MISAKDAAEQVERMNGLDFFPRGKDQTPALKELRLAVQSAKTVEIAERVVTDVLGYRTEAPKPADLRALIWEQNEKIEIQTNDCERCGGTGQQTIWILNTYEGHSLTIKHREILKCPDFIAAAKIEKSCPWDQPGRDNQQLTTAARLCQCRRPIGNPNTARPSAEANS